MLQKRVSEAGKTQVLMIPPQWAPVGSTLGCPF